MVQRITSEDSGDLISPGLSSGFCARVTQLRCSLLLSIIFLLYLHHTVTPAGSVTGTLTGTSTRTAGTETGTKARAVDISVGVENAQVV